MREVVFIRRRGAAQFHTLTACLGLDGSLIFDEGDEYFALGDDPGGEMDDILNIHPAYKPEVYRHLERAFDGFSDTCGELPDERLLCILQALADLEHWKSLDEIEDWLSERGIPFTKQHWSKTA